MILSMFENNLDLRKKRKWHQHKQWLFHMLSSVALPISNVLAGVWLWWRQLLPESPFAYQLG